MRMEWYQRKLAVFLSVILMLEPVVQVLPAMASGKTVMEIAEFEELDESVMVQTVPYGTEYEDLNLPDYLNAQVFEVTAEDEEEDEEVASGSDATSSDASSSAATPANVSSSAATVSDASGEGTSGGEDGYRMIPVTWELSSGPGGLSDYDGETAGTYVFDAVLAAGGYRLGDAILPFIEVEVLEAEPLAVTALLTTNGELIDISDATVVIDGTYTYDGNVQVPSMSDITVTLNGAEIDLSYCTVYFMSNEEAGVASVSVNGDGDKYEGTAWGTFEIERAGLTVSDVTFENSNREYDGTNEVKVSGVALEGVIGEDEVQVDVSYLTGYVNSADAGTYTSVELGGVWQLMGDDAGNYTVTTAPTSVNQEVKILKKTVASPRIELSEDVFKYDGTAKEPEVTVYDDGGVVIPASEYTVIYKNNVDAGRATVNIDNVADGNYEISNVDGKVFRIDSSSFGELGVWVEISGDYTYDGTEQVPEASNITVKLDEENTIDASNYTVSVSDNRNAGTATVTVTGTGNYEGEVDGTFTIKPKELRVEEISFENREYDGTNIVTVSNKGYLSDVIGSDDVSMNMTDLICTVESADVGTYTSVTLSGLSLTGADADNYTVSQTVDANVTISPKTASALEIFLSQDSYEYDGTAKEPSVTTVSLDGTRVSESEYTVSVSYENNVNAGTATATATFTGNYSGSVTKDFTIHPKELTVTGATVSDRAYDGTNVVEVSEVTLDGVISGDVADVDMSESNLTGAVESVNAGTYTSLSLDGTLSLKGGSEDNYTVTLPVTVNLSSPVTIAAKELTVSGAEASDRAYDGTNVVTVTGVTLDGVVYGDDVQVNVDFLTGTVDSADVGTYTSVTLPERLSLLVYSGVESNYTLTQPTTAVGTNVTISPKTVSSPTITLSQTTYEYDGTEKKPDVTVMDGTTEIPSGEYTVNYADNVDAGTAKVTIADVTGGNYTVSGSTTFAITGISLADAVVEVAGSYTYNEAAQTPLASDITVKLGGVTVSSENYTVNVSDNTNAGTATVTVTGTGNYSGSATGGFTIEPKPVGILSISLSETTYEYDGRAKEPIAIVVDTYGEIVPSNEYTVIYANNVEAGTATVVIVDADGGNYKVYESSTTFAITALSLDDAVVTVAGTYTYDGTAQTPSADDITVSLNGDTISSANYTISVSDNTSAGTATVVVTGTGSYSGSATGSFMIAAKAVSGPTITLSETTYEYDGTEKEPGVTVTDGTTEIPSGEYTVSYADNVDTGTATVIITDVAGGNYTVNGTADFTIQAKATEEETDSDERESSVQFSDNGRWMSGARGWWYSDHNGDYPKGEWRQLSWLGKTNWYYFDAEGWMVTGWLDWNGKRYHLHTISDGTLGYMYTGWEQIDGVWYYFDESGALLINGMAPDGHRTDENGASVE